MFRLILGENWTNFQELLKASNIPLFIWFIMGIVVLSLPFIGISLYVITDKFCRKYPIKIAYDAAVTLLFSTVIALFLWDMATSNAIHPNARNVYIHSLPWKVTFFPQKNPLLHTKNSLKKLREEKELLSHLAKMPTKSKTPANIYIFVLESIREDFINSTVTPNIFHFKNNNLSFSTSLANANFTNISWYSLFHSNFPLYWSHTKQQNWESGAIPLYMLKHLGYRTHVYSSAGLNFYGMDELLFGKNHYLADHFHQYEHIFPTPAYAADKKVIDKLLLDIEKKQNHKNNLFIVFLDSTHFNYSWPEDTHSFFTPFCSNAALFTSFLWQKNIEGVKNRYRNSLHFVDHLFGDFIKKLKQQKLYDDAIIVLCSDHGEEFLEHGHLFHGSHLSSMQTHVPIYLKFGKNTMQPFSKDMICHMNIFPSILHYLTPQKDFSLFFDGDSIFAKPLFPYVVTARFNAKYDPYEFFIHNGQEKLTLRFSQKNKVFSCQTLYVQSLRKKDDSLYLSTDDDLVYNHLEKYQPALQKLFPEKEDPPKATY